MFTVGDPDMAGGGFLVPFLPLLCELLITPRYKLKTRVKIVKESKSDAS